MELVLHVKMDPLLPKPPYMHVLLVFVKDSTLFLMTANESQLSVDAKSVFGCPMI
jgi:hypothetical protein